MYEDFKVIDGELFWRSTPNGEWRRCTAAHAARFYAESRKPVAPQQQVIAWVRLEDWKISDYPDSVFCHDPKGESGWTPLIVATPPQSPDGECPECKGQEGRHFLNCSAWNKPQSPEAGAAPDSKPVACWRWLLHGEPNDEWIDGLPTDEQLNAQTNVWRIEYAYRSPAAVGADPIEQARKLLDGTGHGVIELGELARLLATPPAASADAVALVTDAMRKAGAAAMKAAQKKSGPWEADAEAVFRAMQSAATINGTPDSAASTEKEKP